MIKDRVVGLLIFLGILCLAASCHLAHAQDMEHRHALGHGEYQDWASKKTNNCCNDVDCHYLAKDEYRETAEGTELKVGPKWCPVKDEHYVIRGKSPDWSKLHACINQNASYGDECDRILCFMRDGGL
jgi:hypothetical protein